MISAHWIARAKQKLELTVPGPARDALAAEVAEAEAQLERERAELAEVESAGFRRNRYAGTCAVTGAEVKPAAGFVRQQEGRWLTYSWAAALAQARQKQA